MRGPEYIITFYRLNEDGSLGEVIEVQERKLKVPPPRDARAFGKPIKIRTQRGWTAVELAPDARGHRELIMYRKKGSGKYPKLVERFWMRKKVDKD